MEPVSGSGNVYRDFGYTEAELRQAKALLGVQIIRVRGEEGLGTREAESWNGLAHIEFSRIRRAKFGRFTIDRLVGILSKLGREVEVSGYLLAGNR